MRKNTASQYIEVFAFDYSTGAPKTGDAANITVYVSKDAGTLTALGDTSATEISSTNAPGWYRFDLTQSETNADTLFFSGKSATSNVVVVGRSVYTTPALDTSARVTVGSIATDAVNAAALAADAGTEIAAAVLAATVEDSTTVVQSLRLANATLGGKASGLGTTTAVYRDLADSKDRVSATVDTDGNRTAVTRDLT